MKAEKATHIIAKTLSATVKTLIALTLGLHMVSLDWVNRLRSHGSPLIVLEDEKKLVSQFAIHISNSSYFKSQ